jgi:hypothetical protein
LAMEFDPLNEERRRCAGFWAAAFSKVFARISALIGWSGSGLGLGITKALRIYNLVPCPSRRFH